MESVSDSIEADRGRGISRARGTSSREMQFWSAEIPMYGKDARKEGFLGVENVCVH